MRTAISRWKMMLRFKFSARQYPLELGEKITPYRYKVFTSWCSTFIISCTLSVPHSNFTILALLPKSVGSGPFFGNTEISIRTERQRGSEAFRLFLDRSDFDDKFPAGNLFSIHTIKKTMNASYYAHLDMWEKEAHNQDGLRLWFAMALRMVSLVGFITTLVRKQA